MAAIAAMKSAFGRRAVLGNVFLSVALIISLMPAYTAFGNEESVDVAAAQEQNTQPAESQLAADEGAEAQSAGELAEDAVLAEAAPAAPAAATAKQVAKPSAQTGLVYTGVAQTGVAAGEGYSVSGTAAATNAGDYNAMAAARL